MDNASEEAGRISRPETLTCEQQELAVKHLALVGMHLKNRVPTPRQPTRDRDYDDLFQEGCVGLLRAAARYRAGSDGIFAAFAIQRIRGAVHLALHEHFGTIRVPMNAQRAHVAHPDSAQKPVQSLAEAALVDESSWRNAVEPHETIRHRLRRRFERAIRLAVRRMQTGPHATPHRNAALNLIASERLLICDEAARTPLRPLAARAGISSGRACDYERQLLELAQEIMADDPQVAMLIQLAREQTGRFDAALDDDQRRRLLNAALEQFENRFARMHPARRAQMLYELVEASEAGVDRVASNLFRLTGGMTDVCENRTNWTSAGKAIPTSRPASGPASARSPRPRSGSPLRSGEENRA